MQIGMYALFAGELYAWFVVGAVFLTCTALILYRTGTLPAGTATVIGTNVLAPDASAECVNFSSLGLLYAGEIVGRGFTFSGYKFD